VFSVTSCTIVEFGGGYGGGGFIGGGYGGPDIGGGGGPGGTPSGEQGPCKPPTFDELQGNPALGLLPGPFDDDPEGFYNGIGDRNQRVFLNTTDALVDAGVDLSNARFQGFLLSNKPGNLSYGLIITGLNENRLGSLEPFRGGYRSQGGDASGSLEIGFNPDGSAHVDVDLNNPNGGLLPLIKHGLEVFRNNAKKKPTNPNDVTKALIGRGINTTIKGCN
jgi:hypothetical protein